MRAPTSWLRSYCDPQLSAEELADEIAMHSIEVERIDHVGVPSSDSFVVGKVLSVEKHPDADKLSICEVDAGDGRRTIVCGAPNVAAGQTVPVALPGAVMPDGTRLGKARLRGVESNGMILSEAELEIGEDSDGIAVLDEDGVGPGTPLGEVIPVSDSVIELEPTSNRVDCFGIYGIAREVHAITGTELASAPWDKDADASGEGEVTDYASVTVEVPELCPRFSARVFTDVEIGQSPLWLKARLIGAGMRPINNVVDITNYVMLMTAQPLHAFDLDKVPDGALIVRTAEQGEKLTTLDGVERIFDDDAVLVCDRNGPSGIAGIMGGEVSEVSETTTRVLLEVANWNGVNILRTSRKLGLRTDASNRFEKQLHPELALRGQRIASKLMVELCGAKLVPGTIDESAEIPAAHELELRTDRVERLLGMPIEPKLCSEYLRRLDFEVSGRGKTLKVTVPLHRHYDVTREVDLIEEVGRIHGYAENLPSALPSTSGQVGRLTREQRLRRRAEDAMRDLGFDAVVNLSLTDPGMPGRLRIPDGDLRAEPIRVSNPLSAEHSVERTAVLGSLLDAARYNRAHGADRVALFESGRAYLREGNLAQDGVLAGKFVGDRPAPAFEPWRIAALATGALRPAGWYGDPVLALFFPMKGILEALARQLGVEIEVVPGDEPFLHPGVSGRILIDGEDAGWIGEIHPLVCRDWDLDQTAAFEIDLAPLVAASPIGEETYEDVISYPAVQQDIAVVVDNSVPAREVRSAILEGGDELLRSAEMFDLYIGDQVGRGRRSLAFRLTFRAADRTLTDEEVAERRVAIEGAVAKIGGSLRE
jgi:phenylalanyl-tRNA synthetase beta chain